MTFINDIMFPYIIWKGDPRKVAQIHLFVKNNQKMMRDDFQSVSKAIHDFLGDLGVNYGVLMTADGSYVFTETKVKMDALVVKLTTGINYNGVVANAKEDLDMLNTYLAGKTQ